MASSSITRCWGWRLIPMWPMVRRRRKLSCSGAPCNPAEAPSPLNALNLNATNAFQGLLGVGNCLPAGMATGLQYMAAQQRFDPTPQTNARLCSSIKII